MPPSVDEWLPERHLARFVVEVVEGLDLRAMTGRYRGSGEASYHPQLLLGLMIYGYATGCFPAASWSGPPTTRSRSASLPPMSRDCLEIGGQAAIATGGHRSLAGRNFCPKPEPSVPL